jgi:hypothetical protein
MTKLMASLIEEIRVLPPDGLRRAASYIHELKKRTVRRRDTVLSSTAKAFSSAEADAIERAIADGCERIDANAW